jgi:hypothetical protein
MTTTHNDDLMAIRTGLDELRTKLEALAAQPSGQPRDHRNESDLVAENERLLPACRARIAELAEHGLHVDAPRLTGDVVADNATLRALDCYTQQSLIVLGEPKASVAPVATVGDPPAPATPSAANLNRGLDSAGSATNYSELCREHQSANGKAPLRAGIDGSFVSLPTSSDTGAHDKGALEQARAAAPKPGDAKAPAGRDASLTEQCRQANHQKKKPTTGQMLTKDEVARLLASPGGWTELCKSVQAGAYTEPTNERYDAYRRAASQK